MKQQCFLHKNFCKNQSPRIFMYFCAMQTNDIQKAAHIIAGGGLVAFPTETVYGLGANALNPEAVAKIFAAKERPSFDPLIVHIDSFDWFAKLTTNVPAEISPFLEQFMPGPLTVVLPKSDIVPDIVTSGLNTVGIRMPANDIARKLIQLSGCPIAAPSANKFGQLSPSTAAHVRKQLPNIDYILDGGSTSVGIESTIITFNNNECTLLRPGIITPEEIEKHLPLGYTLTTKKSKSIIAPGLLQSHYSPKKPLFIFDTLPSSFPPKSGLILHAEQAIPAIERSIFTSLNGNLLEVAAHLFSALHTMEDTPNIERIYIQSVAPQGLGIAIMDRMKKAAFQYQTENSQYI
ncbi:MAG: threonylcarbamoyl-AMP synthase [Bacteroidales bacterium]|jgi:L-threonylcarbamoyladenylate synthase|nr:threonylcarbamoyl-AMP synthase [Bacteroidales bacterium]